MPATLYPMCCSCAQLDTASCVHHAGMRAWTTELADRVYSTCRSESTTTSTSADGADSRPSSVRPCRNAGKNADTPFV